MKKLFVLLIILVAFLSLNETCFAQSTDSLFLSKEQMVEDMESLHQHVLSYHPDPFYVHSEQEVNDYKTHLQNMLPDSMRVSKFYRIIEQQMNYFRDAHTRIAYYSEKPKYYTPERVVFPLDLQYTEDDLIVKRNYSVHQLQQGDIILSINGMTSSELSKLLRNFTRGETGEISRLMLNENFPYYLWKAFGQLDEFDVTYQDDSGQVNSETIQAMQLGEVEFDRLKAPSENVMEFKELNDSVAYLYIKNFYSGGKKFYERKYKEIFDHLRADGGFEYLIIDNRFNDGGDDHYAELLCKYFADQRFQSTQYVEWQVNKEFKDIFKQSFIPKIVRWAKPIYIINRHTRAIYTAKNGERVRVKKKMIRPYSDQKQFEGEVILLSGVDSFSAGSLFTAMFKDYEMGTVIGRPTGNMSSFFANNIMRGYLKHSRIKIEVSTSYQVRSNGDLSQQAVQPDIYVPEGENSLEYALEFIENKWD